MKETNETKNNKEYEVYIEERKSLVEAEKESAQQFDKAILTLSAGAFAISITFIRQIAPTPKEWTLFFLFIGWVAFILSMLSTLYSFLKSQEACTRQREILEKEYFDTKKENQDINNAKEDIQNRAARLTKNLNYASIVLFVIGVFSLAIFSISNFT